MNLTVYLRADYHLMETGIPIFRQVMVTIVVAENDTPIRLQIERSNPIILAPQLLWLSTKVTDQVDLTKKANPYLRNEEHKQEQERKQPNCRCMINLTSWGLTNRKTAKLFLNRII